MPELATILSFYYLCDHAAATRGLPAEEFMRCMQNYERLKMTFVEEPHAPPGSSERAAQIRLGYARFKSWEQTNAAQVRNLRDQAQHHLSQSTGSGLPDVL